MTSGVREQGAAAAPRNGRIGVPAASAGELPEAYRRDAERVRSAVRARDYEGAVVLADGLQQRVAAERGALHPDALRAQELRAHVSVCRGDFASAAEIYSASATAWAARGFGADTAAARNADYCRRKVLAAGAAVGLDSVRPEGGRRGRRGPVRKETVQGVRRGTGALALACAGMLVGFAFGGGANREVDLRSRPTAGVTAGAGPVAPVLMEVLDKAPEPVPRASPGGTGRVEDQTPAPAPAPAPVPVPSDEPTADAGGANEPVAPARKPYGSGGSAATGRPHSQRPSGGTQTAGPAPTPDPVGPRLPKELASACAAGRESGRFPEFVEQMCRRLPGR
ncbi:hypothetical protein GCM10023235_12850 [Kitasatospora terrestris]|uniref:Uncharacterized protein n=1 Tax=Kitasatospora terrestris TaxID=258051 RepID=A0ABP9DC69_9ACTN